MLLRFPETCQAYIYCNFRREGSRSRIRACALLALVAIPLALAAAAALPLPLQRMPAAATPVLLDAMTTELHRAFTSLGKPGRGGRRQAAAALLPELLGERRELCDAFARSMARWSTARRTACAWPTCRCGWAGRSSTTRTATHRGSAVNSMQLPLGDDREALARTLWLATNTGYGNALDNYLRVKTEAQVRAKEEDTSPDFSEEAPQTILASRRRRWWWIARRGSSGCGRSRRCFANIPTCTRTW